jgi:Uma2 family endonuclease
MTQTISKKERWTTADLEKLPLDEYRYEIINGELIVTRSPHARHQEASGRIFAAFDSWSMSTGLGRTYVFPGVIFSDADNVIPDVIWISNKRVSELLDEAGHFLGAPELVVEVLSPGKENEKRDREDKLKLYSDKGVEEYWICDRFQETIEIYRRQNGELKLTATLSNKDMLTSPLLPGFSYPVAQIFA